MAKNYVSVSGVSTIEELSEIGNFCSHERFNFPVVMGYQVSHKSINQGTANPRQPAFGSLRRITDLTLNYGLVPAFHYYTKDNSTIPGDLAKVLNETSAEGALIQFNTLPPSSKMLKKVKELGFNTIFKVPVSDLSSGGYAVWKKNQEVEDFHFGDVMTLVGIVHDRKKFIDYAMFDPSHGISLPLDLSENSLAARFGKEISRKFPDMGLTYAGGIGPENMGETIRTLSKYFPKGFSIDTESKVRETVKVCGVTSFDKLDINLVKSYLTNAQEAWSKP